MCYSCNVCSFSAIRSIISESLHKITWKVLLHNFWLAIITSPLYYSLLSCFPSIFLYSDETNVSHLPNAQRSQQYVLCYAEVQARANLIEMWTLPEDHLSITQRRVTLHGVRYDLCIHLIIFAVRTDVECTQDVSIFMTYAIATKFACDEAFFSQKCSFDITLFFQIWCTSFILNIGCLHHPEQR